MPNPSATRHIDEETQKLRDEAHTERRQKHEALLRTARNAAAGAAAGQRGALKVEVTDAWALVLRRERWPTRAGRGVFQEDTGSRNCAGRGSSLSPPKG